ncbi:MAG TPA: hypothetical protein VFQ44_03875 [Streptosporangiaceae bacterium]|nr:hypothetical protein [Streptosporangiaceae bacterium]
MSITTDFSSDSPDPELPVDLSLAPVAKEKDEDIEEYNESGYDAEVFDEYHEDKLEIDVDEDNAIGPDVEAILEENEEINLKLKSFLSGPLEQAVAKMARLPVGTGEKGARNAGKITASAYEDVRKKRRISSEVEEARKKIKPLTKKERDQRTAPLVKHINKVSEKSWPKGRIGAGMGGTFPADGTTKRDGRSYYGDRGRQLLRQICVRLYDYAANEAGAKPTEVQALFVSRRIVFAANEDMAKVLLASFRKASHASLLQFLATIPKERTDTLYPTLERARFQDMQHATEVAKELQEMGEFYNKEGRIAQITDTTEEDEDLLNEIFEALLAHDAPGWQGGNLSQAVAWLKSAESEGGVFWCDPTEIGDNVHAEQALAVLLARARPHDDAQIVGTMRPCVGCYLTLLYGVDKLGLQIERPENPGGFWQGTQVDGFYAMIQENMLAFDLVHDEAIKEWNRHVTDNFPRQTFATALHSDEAGLTDKAPAPSNRRTATRSGSDLEKLMKMGPPPKVTYKNRSNVDGDYLEEDDEYDEVSEMSVEPKAATRSSARQQTNKKVINYNVDSSSEDSEEDEDKGEDDH